MPGSPAVRLFARLPGRARLPFVGTQPIRILIVDDHPAILDAVAAAVRAAPGLAVAGVARSLDEGVVVTVFPDGGEKYLSLCEKCEKR